MSSSPHPDPDPQLTDAIARAERRRAKLEDLSDMGMVMSREICTRWTEGPYHPEPRHDQGRSFALVSRAVRLTLALEARVDEQILAMRNGVVPAPKPWGSSAASGPLVSAASEPAALAREGEGKGGDQFAPALREGFEREADSFDEDGEFARDREGLTESDGHDGLLGGDFDACVDVIRADLGLPPLHGKDRFGEAERGGGVISHPKYTDDPDVPTPDFAALPIDPPHDGDGGSAMSLEHPSSAIERDLERAAGP